MLIRNVGNEFPDYTASRILQSPYILRTKQVKTADEMMGYLTLKNVIHAVTIVISRVNPSMSSGNYM
jgi:hypothetical protein